MCLKKTPDTLADDNIVRFDAKLQHVSKNKTFHWFYETLKKKLKHN